MARINWNLPDDLLQKIDERASALAVNRTSYINMALARQIESETLTSSLPSVIELLKKFNVTPPSEGNQN